MVAASGDLHGVGSESPIKESLRESQKKKRKSEKKEKVRWKEFEYMIQTILEELCPIEAHTHTKRNGN